LNQRQRREMFVEFPIDKGFKGAAHRNLLYHSAGMHFSSNLTGKPFSNFFNLSRDGYFHRFWKPYCLLSKFPFTQKVSPFKKVKPLISKKNLQLTSTSLSTSRGNSQIVK
jgi:hypothetical protein